jgi:DNA repair protein RadC
VIFAHNHPSGDPVPSEEDRRITGRLADVGQILGIPMLDHVIVGAGGSYYSFADAGDLDPQSAGYRGMVLR